jgi:hypothetical protein
MRFAPLHPFAVRSESPKTPVKSLLTAASLCIAATASAAQRGSPSNSLPRALAALTAADTDRDGKVGADEARAIPVTDTVFTTQDFDGDGAWSRDEFVLYYRRELVASRVPVGADLEAEVARIQALKRVKVVEEARKQPGGSAAGNWSGESVEVRLTRATEELEKLAASQKAAPEDFQRIRNLVILGGRSATAPANGLQSPPAQASLLRTLDQMESRARAGQYVKEDFEAFRRAAAGRAPQGAIVGGRPQGPPQAIQSGATPAGPAQARRRAAEAEGAKPARPGAAPQSRPTPPPAPPPRPPRNDGKDETGRSRP